MPASSFPPSIMEIVIFSKRITRKDFPDSIVNVNSGVYPMVHDFFRFSLGRGFSAAPKKNGKIGLATRDYGS